MVSTTRKLCYLAGYVGNGAAFTLLTKASQRNSEGYAYPPLAIVLFVEVIKFIIASVISFTQTTRKPLDHIRFLRSQWQTGLMFMFVAFGYFIYNCLQYFNLRLVTGPTYRIIISTKVMWSGWLMQWAFNTPLSGKQWLALLLLIVGCGLEQLGSFNLDTGILALVCLSLQAFCSSAAGVFNQYLLKSRDTSALGLWEKNMFMYLWGIVFTSFSIYFLAPELVAQPEIFSEIFYNEPLLPYIVLTNAFMGFSTSLLLRDMNVLYKEYANFAEMLVLVFGTWIAFGTTPNSILIPATIVVSASLYMYNMEAARMDELRAQEKAVPLVPLSAVQVAPARSD
jgi:drug/metabolite transporter (DMT)-like permease